MIMQVSRGARVPTMMHANFWIVGDPMARFCGVKADTNGTNECVPGATTAVSCECPDDAGDACPSDNGSPLFTI